MSFTALKERIEGFVAFLQGKGGSRKPYPDNFDIINLSEPKNWNKVIPRAYSFKVLDLKTGAAHPQFDEYTLQINPQDMMQDENFAITITPTQDGVVSEHNGIVLRDLIISGTTGIHPLKGAGGVTNDGKIIGGDPKKSKSGYQEFNDLRNYFRAYSEIKKNPADFTKNWVLVFINRKDIERLIIEPVKFTGKRQGARGFLYDYTFVTKVIGNFKLDVDKKAVVDIFSKLDNIIGTVNDAMDTGLGVLLEGSEILGQVEREVNNTLFEPLRKLDLAVKTVQGIAYQVWNMGDDFINKLNASQVLAFFSGMVKNVVLAAVLPKNLPVAAQAGGAALLALGASTLKQATLDESLLSEEQQAEFNNQKVNALVLPRSFFENLLETVIRIRDNATESFGLGDSTYDTFSQRTSTSTPSPTKQTTDIELGLIAGFFQITTALNLLLSFSGGLVPSDYETKLNAIEDEFSNDINLPVPSSVTEIVIAPYSTLESISSQYLGDISRWIELVHLNSLIPPYISETSSNKRVKAWGDRLLVPGTGNQTNTSIKITKESIYTKNLTETEKRLGIDIRVNEESYDLLFGNNSDVLLSVGGKNIQQALSLKLRYEKGDLKYHPHIGLGMIVGEKITNLTDVYDNLTDTILSDPRIDQIKNFRLSVDGSTVFLGLDLKVAESETPVPTNLII